MSALSLNKNKIIGLVGLAILIALTLFASQSYFNSKEITAANEKCHEVNGSPVVHTSKFNLSYSFECENPDK